jgi:lipopolysaccharide cholinephosphotransferase
MYFCSEKNVTTLKMVLSETENAALRQRFAPEGSTLWRQQQRMLEMMVWLDDVCRRHRIPYWLGSGTLLGAVRHGGFIPWDDDVDIEFRREDYPRLLQVLTQETAGTDYALQTHDTDPGYFFTYAKLRDRRSRLQEQIGYDRIFTYQGIYLDLFVLEPMTKPLHWLSNRTFGIIYKVLRNPEYNTQQLIRKTDSIYRVNMRFVFPLLRLLSRLFSPRLLTYSPGIPFESQRDPAELFPLSTVVFEGHRFSAPHNPEAYLRRMFGNWQRLPDIDKISTHTANLEFT